MIFSLFKKNSGYREKEMDNLLEKEVEEVKEVKNNKLVKAFTYLQDLINI
jgi:hypothetical protein